MSPLTLRKLEDENDHLRAGKEHLHREIKNLRRELDELVYEDNVRNNDCDNLQRQIEVLQLRCEEFASKESELSRELKEKSEQVESFLLKEEGYRHKIKCMESHSTGCDDDVGRMTIKVERMLQREKKLEDEILGHVKTHTEIEQQNTMMYHTIETLKRNNETCNEQRAQLQKENNRLEEMISDYEQQSADRKREVDLQTENNELRRKQDESANLKCALQSELFILKRQLNEKVSRDGEKISSCKSTDTNVDNVNGELPLNINDQHLKRNESDFNAYLVGVNQQQCSVSYEDLKIFAQKKEEEIEVLIDQRTRYQEESRLLEEEVHCLKANYEAIEDKLDEHNLYIDDLATQCSSLQEQIATRNNLIHQQEEEIDQLRSELEDCQKREDKDSKSIKEIQRFSLNLTRELDEKNRENEELKACIQRPQQEEEQVDSQDSNILLQQQQDLFEEIQDLKQRIVELEEENFELLQQRVPPNASSKSAIISSSIEPELESSLPVLDSSRGTNNHQDPGLQSRIRELEDEVDCLRQNISQQQQHQFVDYSFEDEHLVSRERYLDLVDSVRNKELIISDLQEHINLLEGECASLNAQQRVESSVDNEMEAPMIAPKLGLRLPSPDIAAAKKSEAFSFQKKRNSLPPLPTANANSKQSRPPPETNGMREKRAVDAGNGDDMRGKVIKLNAELLEKKIIITKLEDDLKTTKRRFARLEESHRYDAVNCSIY